MNNKGMTTIEVKQINRQRVYRKIYDAHAISKHEISVQLNMGLTTVTQNLKSLEDDGWICRTGYYESTGGRKAQAIEIVRHAKTAIGAFILKRKIILVAVDLYGDIIRESVISKPFEQSEEYYKLLGREVMKFANSVDSDPENILGVGIAIQGIISPDGQSVKYGKLLQHTGLRLEDIARYIPYKCTLEHDSKAAAYAEIWGKEPCDAFVILTNKNLGSALVVNGEIHHGKSMYSGTAEHMCVRPGGRECYCGGRGCLDAYCSAESLQKQIGEKTFMAFFKKVREGDNEEAQLWDSYLEVMSEAIRNINTVFDSDIIISGELAPFFNDDDIRCIKSKITSAPFFGDRNMNIYLGNHGESAPAVGSALPLLKAAIEAI